MLIARSPRNSGAWPEKATAQLRWIAEPRLALFERGGLEREVDILFIWFAIFLPAAWPEGRRYPIGYFRSGLGVPVALPATATLPRSQIAGVLRLSNFSSADPGLPGDTAW